jgi:aminoglycoside phosphotransferase
VDVSRIVAVHEEADTIEQYALKSDYEWHIVDVGETTSLGDTIATALKSLESADLTGRRLYLNFGDTLVSPIRRIDGIDYISYKEVDRTYRWTTFRTENGKVGQIWPKYETKNDGSQSTFVGQFGLTDAGDFLSYLSDSKAWRDQTLPRFYAALLAYLDSKEYELHTPETWYDVGHLDTYHRTTKEFLNAREFNELQVDTKNVITKRSEDSRTLTNEIEWYQQIPTKLQPYLPRIYDCSTDLSEAYLSMEYIGYPSLADIQLYGSHGQHIWNGIFHRIFDLLSDFGRYSPDPESEAITEALEEIYLTKTRRRLDQLRECPAFEEIFASDYILINGNAVPSLDNVLMQLGTVVRRENLFEQESMSIIHGDLCLPNILYDPRNEILKLIDPRGEFGKFTIYGDQRYDLAKLRHSFAGHYEHLINGHYNASWSAADSEISYDIQISDAQQRRTVRFDSVLKERTDTPLREVKLIEALLFLSMVSLHPDSHKRQLCMLAQGLEKITPYLDEGVFKK